mmetsp:Transcript_17642/g.50391  ORF Transcript_17642/g.50391 Transcript_17642/m.50391 type:complete len:278 (-) Transcript_17642:153-986(-)
MPGPRPRPRRSALYAPVPGAARGTRPPDAFRRAISSMTHALKARSFSVPTGRRFSAPSWSGCSASATTVSRCARVNASSSQSSRVTAAAYLASSSAVGSRASPCASWKRRRARSSRIASGANETEWRPIRTGYQTPFPPFDWNASTSAPVPSSDASSSRPSLKTTATTKFSPGPAASTPLCHFSLGGAFSSGLQVLRILVSSPPSGALRWNVIPGSVLFLSPHTGPVHVTKFNNSVDCFSWYFSRAILSSRASSGMCKGFLLLNGVGFAFFLASPLR